MEFFFYYFVGTLSVVFCQQIKGREEKARRRRKNPTGDMLSIAFLVIHFFAEDGVFPLAHRRSREIYTTPTIEAFSWLCLSFISKIVA